MGIYSSVLTAAKDRLEALLAPDGWRVALNDAPAFVPLTNELPCVIVAPRDGLDEVVTRVTYANQLAVAYDVYVGTFVDSRAQQTPWLFKRLDVREAVRLSLYEPRVLGVAQEFDVNYDPAGAGGMPAPPNVKGSWQRSSYLVRSDRSSSARSPR